MDATLKLKNKPNVIGAASNFAYHWAINSGLDPENATRLAVALSELVTDVVLFAFNEIEGEMEVSFLRHDEYLEVVVRELGEPFNPDRHRYNRERALQEGHFDGAGFELVRKLTDDFIYINKGKQGKEFRLIQKLLTPHITELLSARELSSNADVTDSDDHYSIERVTVEDAEDISKLIYRTYGHTYYKDKHYFPRQLELSIEQKEKYGVIARTGKGVPVGYFAVLCTTDSNICEVGEAVVATRHRRKGIMKGMLRELIRLAREKQLLAAFGEATSAHIVSQRVNAHFGFHSTAIQLAISPSMALSGFEEKAYAQEVTSVMEFVLLLPPEPRTVYLPKGYQKLLLDIYAALDIPVQVLPSRETDLPELSEIELLMEYKDRFALLIVHRFGLDFAGQVAQVVRDIEANDIQTISIDMPVEDPATPQHVPVLHRMEFIFSGLMPLFHQERDYLRLQRTQAKLNFDLIKTYSSLGKRLKKIIQKEYHATPAGKASIVSKT